MKPRNHGDWYIKRVFLYVAIMGAIIDDMTMT